jgi:Transposase DDE domain group 1
VVQRLSLPGGELEDGAPGGGQGGVPLWGIVSARGIHCDQPGNRQPAVVRFYNKRGTAEQWIKEGKQAVKMTRLSCHRFRPNEVRLWLSLMAYNLGNLWRRLVDSRDQKDGGCDTLNGAEESKMEIPAEREHTAPRVLDAYASIRNQNYFNNAAGLRLLNRPRKPLGFQGRSPWLVLRARSRESGTSSEEVFSHASRNIIDMPI